MYNIDVQLIYTWADHCVTVCVGMGVGHKSVGVLKFTENMFLKIYIKNVPVQTPASTKP